MNKYTINQIIKLEFNYDQEKIIKKKVFVVTEHRPLIGIIVSISGLMLGLTTLANILLSKLNFELIYYLWLNGGIAVFIIIYLWVMSNMPVKRTFKTLKRAKEYIKYLETEDEQSE